MRKVVGAVLVVIAMGAILLLTRLSGEPGCRTSSLPGCASRAWNIRAVTRFSTQSAAARDDRHVWRAEQALRRISVEMLASPTHGSLVHTFKLHGANS